MTERILPLIVQFVTHVIGSLGYAGIAALMGIESACIPLPSEIIMPLPVTSFTRAGSISFGQRRPAPLAAIWDPSSPTGSEHGAAVLWYFDTDAGS